MTSLFVCPSIAQTSHIAPIWYVVCQLTVCAIQVLEQLLVQQFQGVKQELHEVTKTLNEIQISTEHSCNGYGFVVFKQIGHARAVLDLHFHKHWTSWLDWSTVCCSKAADVCEDPPELKCGDSDKGHPVVLRRAAEPNDMLWQVLLHVLSACALLLHSYCATTMCPNNLPVVVSESRCHEWPARERHCCINDDLSRRDGTRRLGCVGHAPGRRRGLLHCRCARSEHRTSICLWDCKPCQ